MSKIFNFILVVILLLIGSLSAQTLKSSERQKQGLKYEVDSIRLMQLKIESDVKVGKIKSEIKAVEHCVGDISEKVIFIDDKGKVRKLYEEGGSDDSGVSFEYFYDEQEQLRLLVIGYGSVRGVTEDQKIFFSVDRKILKVEYRYDSVNNEDAELNEHKRMVLARPKEDNYSIKYFWEPLTEYKKKLHCD